MSNANSIMNPDLLIPAVSQHICEVCGMGPRQGIAIYRTGGKGAGVNPHWRCSVHNTQDSHKVSDDVAVITAVIEGIGQTQQ